MNIRKIVALVFLFLSFNYSNALAISAKDSILWKATYGTEIIYLLGTTHVGYQAQYPIRTQIFDSFQKSTVYVTESMTPFLSEKEAGEQLLKISQAEPGKTLKALLQDKECGELAGKENFEVNLKKILGDVLPQKLAGYSPRAAIYLTSSYPAPNLTKEDQDKLQITQGLEFYFSAQAEKIGIRHESLDPEYWDGLDALNNSDICKLAIGMASVHSAEDFSEKQGYELMHKLRDLWISGDSLDITQFAFTWPDSYAVTHGNVEHKWFELRNRFMTENIIKISQREKSTIFVAVGAAHLSGKAGIISKLRDAGFVVTPL